jgi:GSH-dependent disulfide-bond oxidoreductase
MIDLYTWTTPNGRKASIMLEETGLPYTVLPVDLGAGQQLAAGFSAINPNQKIPAIVDHDADGGPLTLFESGAILIYLAEKSGRLLAADVRTRAATMQWLMFQMSQVGPMIGQAGHFVNQAPERIPYAIKRFVEESQRIVGVLEQALQGKDYLAGTYSIADIATYPWIDAAWTPLTSMMPEHAVALRNVRRWLDRLAERPAVQRGMRVPATS